MPLALARRSLGLAALVAILFAPAVSLRGQVTDASASLQLIGNPYTAAGYTGTNPHRSVKDIRHHFGRLYVGYGHSNNGNANRFLFADPVAMTVGTETPPNITITEEEQTSFRVFDDTLYLVSYDPTSGNQYYARSPAGAWSKVTVNDGTDHARDLHLHGSRVWYSNNNGTTTSPYPNLLAAPISAPSGAFVRQNQPEPAGFPFVNSNGFSIILLPEAFFPFAGRLYAVSPNYLNGEVPFIIRHNNNDYQPWWSVAVGAQTSLMTPPYRLNTGIFTTTRHGLTYSPVEIWHAGQRRLFCVGHLDNTGVAFSLFHTPDPETTPATPLALPDQPSGTLIAMYLFKRQGRVFAATFRLNGDSTRTIAQIHQLQPGADPTQASSWPALFRFTTTAMIGNVNASTRGTPLDYADGVFYFVASVSYNPLTQTGGDPADLNGAIYKLAFPGVLGRVATPPPELPPAGGLTYLLDNYDERRANPLGAGTSVTISVTDADSARPGNEAVITRSAASSSLQFLQLSPSRTSALLRALSASPGGKLRAWVKTIQGQNAGTIGLRWGLQTDAWPDATGTVSRTYPGVSLPNSADAEATLELDLAANPAVVAAAQAYAAGSGTTFRLFIDNGPGPYWSGAVRWILDDVTLVDLPRPAAPAPDSFTAAILSPDTVRLIWGPADSDHPATPRGWILERRATPTSAWESVSTLGGDVATLDLPTADAYRLTPYTSFGRGASLVATPVTLEAPAGPPASFSASGSSGRVDLSWAAASFGGLTGVELQRRDVPGGAWTALATLAADATAYADTAVASGTLYEYRGRYTSLVTPSAWSPVRAAGTPAAPPPVQIAHWRLDETSGTAAADSSGNGLNLSFAAGSTSWAAGQVGNALTLSGTSGRGQLADNALLNGMDKLSVSFWVRPTNLNGGATGNDARFVVSKRSTTTDGVFSIFFFTGDRLFVDLASNNDRFSSNTVFANNTWYHIAVVYDGALPAAQRARLYVNGVLDTTATESSSALSTNTAPLTIGAPTPTATNLLDGSVDDLRLIRAAIPPEGIATLMGGSLPTPRPAAGTLARWRADHFAANILSNPALESTTWGDLATPAGDGVPNLLKYHLGLAPTSFVPASSLPTLELSPAGDVLTYVYSRSRHALGTSGQVLWSTTLESATWSAEGVVEEIIGQTDTHDQVEASVGLTGRPRLFLRLRVEPR